MVPLPPTPPLECSLSQAGWVNHLHLHPVSAWTTHTNMYPNMWMKCKHKRECCPPPYQWWVVHAWYPDSPPPNLTSQCCTVVSIDICTAVVRFFSWFWRHTHAWIVHPWAWVWVFLGTGAGSPGKPQGYPCQSLGGVHVMVLGSFEKEVAKVVQYHGRFGWQQCGQTLRNSEHVICTW